MFDMCQRALLMLRVCSAGRDHGYGGGPHSSEPLSTHVRTLLYRVHVYAVTCKLLCQRNERKNVNDRRKCMLFKQDALST